MTRHTEDLLDEIADLERRCAGCEAQAELLYRIYDETDGAVDLTDAAWAFEEIADQLTRAIWRREDEMDHMRGVKLARMALARARGDGS